MGSPEEPPLPSELSPRQGAGSSRIDGGRGGRGGRKPRKSPLRRIWKIVWRTVAVLVVLALVAGVATFFWANSRIDHVNAVTDYSGRPSGGPGTNWLLTGSDSRSNLTAAQAKEYHTGTASAGSGGTDTILLLHKGSDGSVLVSIPRDSWVTIPAYTDSKGVQHSAQQSKINAAYNYGGPQLLVKTVETATGVHVDHYAEVGFSGVVDVVDALGGLHICLPQAVHDSYSGADLDAGCQTLTGVQTLQLVRSRHAFASSDFARMENQRRVLSALADQVVSPSVLLNPFKLYPVISAALGSLSVDQGSGILTLARMGWSLEKAAGSGGKQLTVPTASTSYTTPTGESAVEWDSAQASTLFQEIQNDQKITVSSGGS
jgi:LCP family protein required for cell wall assembly